MDYRLYVYDGGHIARAVDIEAEDDDHAVVMAKAQCESECRERRCELWRRQRLLKAFGEGLAGPPP